MKFVLIFIFCFLFSCADMRYQSARNWIYDQQYEEACYFLESLLEESPENQEYKALLEIAKENAGQAHLEKIRKYANSDIETSQHFYDKARVRIPDNLELARWEERLKIARADVDTGVMVAQNWMQQNRWDEALLHLEKLQNYKASYPYLKNLRQTALKGSFDFHFLQGMRYFKNQEYEKSLQSFSVCLTRGQDRELSESWVKAAQTHLLCLSDIREAKESMEQTEYARSFSLYQNAREKLLALDILQREPLLLEKIEEGIALSRQKETRQIYERAIREESFQTCSGYFQSIRLYRTCLSKISPFLDCEEKIEKNKKMLAVLFQREGMNWIQYPALRYIGLAHRYLEEAYSYFPNLPGLAKQKEQVQALCLLKLKNTVKIRVLGGEETYRNFLQESLVDYINQRQFPFLVASSGDARETLSQYKERLADLNYSLPQEEEILFPVYQLNLEILESSAKKTGENSFMECTSQYFSHKVAIPSWEFLQYTGDRQYYEEERDRLKRIAISLDEQVQARQKTMVERRSTRDQYKESLSRIAEIVLDLTSQKEKAVNQKASIQYQVEENNKYISKAETEIQQYKKKLQEVLTPEQIRYYQDKISDLSKKIAICRRYNREEAAERLRILRSLIRRLEKEISDSKEEEEKQQALYDESERKFQASLTSYNQAQSLQNRMYEEQKTSDREYQKLQYTPVRERNLDVKAAYQYKYSPYQVFGTVLVKGYILDVLKEKRLLLLESKIQDLSEEKCLRDVHTRDSSGLRSKEIFLPSSDDFERRLQERAIQDLQNKLEIFFLYHHRRYWDQAMEASSRNHTAETAENLSLFLQGAKSGEEYKEAALKLQEILYSSNF